MTILISFYPPDSEISVSSLLGQFVLQMFNFLVKVIQILNMVMFVGDNSAHMLRYML